MPDPLQPSNRIPWKVSPIAVAATLIFSLISLPQSSKTLAQGDGKIPNYCQKNESLFIVAETKGFWINICGGDLPHSYVGVSKTNKNRIRLPLKNYEIEANYSEFEAVNKDIT